MDKQNNIVNLSNISYKENSYKFKQSANALFNFMKKKEYLKLILKNKAFIPRYCEEVIDYLKAEGIEKIAFPMTCFCDIHVQKIIYHCSFYGYVGIGMYKEWGINKGIQPIHYINNNSRIYKELSTLFKNAYDIVDEIDEDETEEYKNYILEHILFLKPLVGKMYRDTEYIKKNFHDEKEWRYVPYIDKSIDLPLIIPQEHTHVNAYKPYSDAIKNYKQMWLCFEYKDIKYLFLENEADRQDIINYIMEELDIDKNEKYELISKIIVLDQIEEDM